MTLDRELEVGVVLEHRPDLLERGRGLGADPVAPRVEVDPLRRHPALGRQRVVQLLAARRDAEVAEQRRLLRVGVGVEEDLVGAAEVGVGHVEDAGVVQVHLHVLPVAPAPGRDGSLPRSLVRATWPLAVILVSWLYTAAVPSPPNWTRLFSSPKEIQTSPPVGIE